MDFSSRSTPTPAPGTPVAAPSSAKKSKNDGSKWARIGTFLIGLALAVLLIALVVAISTSGKSTNEGKYVDTSKLQAVFLNTGQVYFGNVKTMNSKYLVLTNIYYLQTTNSNGSTTQQQNSGTNVTLVKLGCELHEPFDQMLINRDQVTFWENLQDNGQVAKAVTTFEKQNPNGQKCADQSSAASSNSASSAQNAGSGNNTPATKP
jgi:hypothetical protein